MTAKEQLLQELEQVPEDLIEATLGFLRSAKVYRQNTSTSEASSDNPLLSLLAEFDEFAANNMPADEVAHLPMDGALQPD